MADDAEVSGNNAQIAQNLDINVPDTVGRCKVEKLLGSGAMGYVFKAKHMTLNIPIAIKILKKQYSSYKTYSDRFIREAQVAAKLNHQNIIRVYDCGYENNLLYLIMEYVNGGNLSDLLEKSQHAMAPERVIDIGIAVSQALVEAEKYHIIHRDIKPANIMLTDDGVVKLADLGLAKQLDSPHGKSYTLTMDMIALGTPVYMSPEQALNAKKCDIRSDIYALGITLYHLLAGKPPFLADDAVALFKLHQTSKAQSVLDFNAAIPPEFDLIIEKCIRKKAEDRYQSPKELLDDLTRLKYGKELKYAAGQEGKRGKKEKSLPKPSEKKISVADKNKGKLKTIFIRTAICLLGIILLINIVVFLKRAGKQEITDKTDNEPVANYKDFVIPDKSVIENLQPDTEKNIDVAPFSEPSEPVEHSTPSTATDLEKSDNKEMTTPPLLPEKSGDETPKIKIDTAKIPPQEKSLPPLPAQNKTLSSKEQQYYAKLISIITNVDKNREKLKYERQNEQIFGDIFCSAAFGNWEEQAERIADMTDEKNTKIPEKMRDFLDALDFACCFSQSLDDETIQKSFGNRILDFNRDNFQIKLKYSPDNGISSKPELSGDYKDTGNVFLIPSEKKLRIKIPFILHPDRSDIKKRFDMIVNKLPPGAGFAIKYNFGADVDKSGEWPQYLSVYFMLLRTQGKTIAKIILQEQDNLMNALEKLEIDSKLFDKPFVVKTQIQQDKLAMMVGEKQIVAKIDPQILSRPELMIIDVFTYKKSEIGIEEIEITSQVFPFWLALELVKKNSTKARDYFAETWTKE
jgi:serine/threonine protein kinase